VARLATSPVPSIQIFTMNGWVLASDVSTCLPPLLGLPTVPLPGGYRIQGWATGLFRIDVCTAIGRVPTNAPRAGTWAGEGSAKTLAKAVVVEGAWELISTGSCGAQVLRVRLDPSVRIPGLHSDRVRVFCRDARLQWTPATLKVACIAVHR
jgi:hypothetical protein